MSYVAKQCLQTERDLRKTISEAVSWEDPNPLIRSTREVKDHGRLQLDQLVWGTQSGAPIGK